MKELCPQKDAPLRCREFRPKSGFLGSLKKPARVSRVIPTSGVSAKVRSSSCGEFQPKLGLSRIMAD
jgi:hypothetical protein